MNVFSEKSGQYYTTKQISVIADFPQRTLQRWISEPEYKILEPEKPAEGRGFAHLFHEDQLKEVFILIALRKLISFPRLKKLKNRLDELVGGATFSANRFLVVQRVFEDKDEKENEVKGKVEDVLMISTTGEVAELLDDRRQIDLFPTQAIQSKLSRASRLQTPIDGLKDSHV